MSKLSRYAAVWSGGPDGSEDSEEPEDLEDLESLEDLIGPEGRQGFMPVRIMNDNPYVTSYYRYKPLDPLMNEIRLLTIEPTTPVSLIKCQIQTVPWTTPHLTKRCLTLGATEEAIATYT